MIPLVIAGAEYKSRACELCRKYGFEFVHSPAAVPAGVASYLFLDAEGLALVANSESAERVQVDYLNGRSGYRLSTMSNTSQHVLKAVGFNKDKIGLRVLDATAGLGVDGILMAAAGCVVRLLERSPVMAALLDDGFSRVCAEEEPCELQEVLAERVHLERVDSMDFFKTIGGDEYDVIYLDPMFPERKKTSKVKKEMQLARLFAASEDNAEELLFAALDTPVRRVVIKRPLKSALVKKGFSSQVKGKSIRFDIYLR